MAREPQPRVSYESKITLGNVLIILTLVFGVTGPVVVVYGDILQRLTRVETYLDFVGGKVFGTEAWAKTKDHR